ncbi:hypothetical protein [Thiolapillus sp.]
MIHHLLVPDLLEPPPASHETADILRFPVLERLLARADRKTAPGNLDANLFRLFQLQEHTAAVAPLCWLADSGEEASGWVLQATPVYLRADRDRVLLFPLEEKQMELQQAQRFASVFNRHFAQDGLVLKAASPLCWYLFTRNPVCADFADLSRVAGRSMGSFMPQGTDERFWRGVINETQMLFFQAEENQAREAQGRLPVSGLWFSGAGKLPEKRPVAPAEISGEYCLLAGLKKYATSIDPDCTITVIDGMAKARREQDVKSWLQAAAELEQRLTDMASSAQEICLYPCQGAAYYWKQRMKYRLWRRAKSLVVKGKYF